MPCALHGRRVGALSSVLTACAVLPFSLPLSVLADSPSNPSHSAVTELPTVQITATRQSQPVTAALADMSVIERDEIENFAAGGIIDLIAQQSGIQITRDGGLGSGQALYMRGANSDQTLVIVDGLPINSLDMYGSPLRFINLSDVERIEILRGPASSLYGANAVGGVIHIITRPAAQGKSAEVALGLGTQNSRQAAASVSYGNELLRARLGIEQLASGGISSQRYALSGSRDADNDAYRNSNVSFSASLTPAAGHELGVMARQNRGTAWYDSGMTPPSSQYAYRNTFVASQWQLFSRNAWTDKWTSTVRYGVTDDRQKNYFIDEYAFVPNPPEQISPMNSRLQTLSWQNDVKLPLGQAIVLLEYQRQNGKFSHTMTPPKVHNRAAMLGWNAEVGDHSWQIHLRRDNHSQYKAHSTWNAAYRWQFAPAWSVRLGYGTAFKAPTLYQLYYEDVAWNITANPNLQPEKSRNRELALVWRQGGQEVSATVYRNDVRNLIGFVSDPVTWAGSYMNTRRARLQGVTLAWSAQFDRWRLRASYDYLDAKDLDSGFMLGRRARHSARAVVEYHASNWKLGGESEMAGRRYNDNSENNKLAGYALVNVYGHYRLSPNWRVEARINNLFDHRYETSLVGVVAGQRYPYNTLGLNAFLTLRWQGF